jgi:DNA-binding CsgD family transcriptional regulator
LRLAALLTVQHRLRMAHRISEVCVKRSECFEDNRFHGMRIFPPFAILEIRRIAYECSCPALRFPVKKNFMSQPDQRNLEALTSLALTPREAEVLFWISEGKSNQDIGVILGAKTGTICKHVEHIFGKLNVENRTAAAVVALETYRSVAPVSDSTPGQPWATIAGFIATQFCALWSDSPELYGEIARLVA